MTTQIVGEVVIDQPNHILLTDEDEAPSRRAELDERLAALSLSLQKKRNEAVNHRAGSGVESRWLEDLAAYHGEEGWFYRPDVKDTTTKRIKKASRRSRQYVQMTRQKTNAGCARLSDMLLPTDDRNWEYAPTPVPELMELLKKGQDELYLDPKTQQPLEHPDQPPPPEVDPNDPNPQPPQPRMLTNADMAADLLRIAHEKAMRMQKEVDDQLTECQFNAVCRRAVDSAGQLGTGIIRGPVPMNRVKKKWIRRNDEKGKSYFDLQIEEDTRPQSTFVDVWDAFPAPGCGENIHDGGYFWHREVMSPSMLKDLARLAERDDNGYQLDALLDTLKEDPRRVSSTGSVPEGLRAEDSMLHDLTNYEVWNYWGEADVEDLEALGVNMDSLAADELRLKSISVVVSLCHDRVIRIVLNPDMKGEIPFDFFPWEMVAGSPWGVGVPFLMRYAQKAMNAAWRQMQDNAGVSHGPQVIINRAMIDPAEAGDWEVYGMKQWMLKEDADPSRAFSVIHIPSNQVELQNIFMLAKQLADEETSLPQLLTGNDAPNTMGAAVIAQNNTNVVLKRFARNWDDRMTTPHLRRYYDWNMANNENEEIKGDFTVQARGSTHLVVRDLRQQELMLIQQMKADPAFAAWIHPERLAKAVLEATSVGSRIMMSEAEKLEMDRKAAESPPPQNPMVEVAQIRAQTEIKKTEIETAGEQQNLALQAEEAGRNDEREMAKLYLQVQMKTFEYAEKHQMQLSQIKADMAALMINRMPSTKDLADQMRPSMGSFQKPGSKKPQRRREEAVQ